VRSRLSELLLIFVFLGSVSAQAISVVDLSNSMTSWSMRFTGFRSYRIPVSLKSGKKCIVGVTKHVNPRVKNFTIMLQGLGADRWTWNLLLKHYRHHPGYSGFVAIDWPYHGDTNCDGVQNMDDVVEAVAKAIRVMDIPVSRIIGASLGAVPAALLAPEFPEAQQIWITPPFLKREKLKSLLGEVMKIRDESGVQALIFRSSDLKDKFPRFVLRDVLFRVQRSQEVLKFLDLNSTYKKILNRQYYDLLVVVGAKDQLTPFQDLAPEVASLIGHPFAVYPCSHDILRFCGASVKEAIERSRLKRAKY